MISHTLRKMNQTLPPYAYCPPAFMGADHSWSLPGPRGVGSGGLWDARASPTVAPAQVHLSPVGHLV